MVSLYKDKVQEAILPMLKTLKGIIEWKCRLNKAVEDE